MRKVDPKHILADFDAALEGVEEMLDCVLVTTIGGPQRRLAEAAFLMAAVLWEGFVFDLFIAYERNLTLNDAQSIRERASSWLAPRYASKFATLSDTDDALINLWCSMRCFLAHRSRASSAALNDAMANSKLPDAFRRGPHRIHEMGWYLVSWPRQDSGPRVDIHLREMRRVAASL